MSLRTIGLDVGTGMVKSVAMEVPERGEARILWKRAVRIRRRDPISIATECWEQVREELGWAVDDIAYVATTGEGDRVEFRSGHFYSMTAHARGAVFLVPECRSVIDVGALHGRAIRIDHRGKVLAYRMTSQCASGTGQFLENISRYLGVTLDEVGPLSLTATAPEAPSGICAVLAETDVINMVSRGLDTPDILRGIHDSIAKRLVKLLRSSRVEGPVMMTGGLSRDTGLFAALQDGLAASKGEPLQLCTHPDGILAGAIGAALWGAFRHRKLGSERAPAFRP